jgi:hypothetical protein
MKAVLGFTFAVFALCSPALADSSQMPKERIYDPTGSGIYPFGGNPYPNYMMPGNYLPPPPLPMRRPVGTPPVDVPGREFSFSPMPEQVAQTAQQWDMLVVVLEDSEGGKNEYRDSIPHENCSRLLKLYRQTIESGKPAVLTFEGPPKITGKLTSASIMA